MLDSNQRLINTRFQDERYKPLSQLPFSYLTQSSLWRVRLGRLVHISFRFYAVPLSLCL
jgi:hypothetical protein